MQSLSDMFANNRLLELGLFLAALAVVLAVGFGLFRLTFGRRLHMSGGRTRQPRLGVVDAFDLDRQRQLVIVRRDNVEHLLMIGGPNDLLIEAAIVRAPAGLALRDKDNGVTPSVGIPAPSAQQPGGAPLTAPLLPPVVSNGSGEPLSPAAGVPLEPVSPPVAPERERVPPQVEPGPAVPPPAMPPQSETRLPSAATLAAAGPRPLPQRPTSTTLPSRPPVTPAPRPVAAPQPRPNFSRATPVAPPPSASTATSRVEPPLNRGAGGAPTVEPDRGEPAGTGPAPAIEARGEPKGSSGPVAMPVASPAPGPSVSGPSTLPPRPQTPPRQAPLPSSSPRPQSQRAAAPAAAPPRGPVPSLGSLEEEMAKLLGRPVPPPDQSNGQ